ncbi:hypothetical protein [Haemophilus parahaemolyticus]|uniref:hypothetical protein n=1 Tax=Haemophilus parahaemolyticus TaxID=735 RepID=UPI0028EA5076|nr:hypothetical protein [Haemophilus parahaemolyticus]
MSLERFKATLRQKIAEMKSTKSKAARIGIIEQQHYDDGTPVAYVAAIHEYGSPTNHIPPRPFFRPTIAEKQDNWKNVVRRLLKQGKSVEEVLALLGQRAASDVFQTLSELTTPPLALSTKIARNRKAHKGKNGRKRKPKAVSIKPLIDTKRLSSSIASDVVDKK